MPRGRTAPLLNRRSKNVTKKIIIRPYEKPPQLPANYYEETAVSILQGCLAVLNGRLHLEKSTSAAQSLSLQNAYTATVHLVSHQYGARLYADVVASMKEAAELVLPSASSPDMRKMSNHHDDESSLLANTVQQYHAYSEYLLLLKHICLPLDRTWQWQWLDHDDGKAIPLHSTTTTTSSSSGGGSSSSHLAADTTNASASPKAVARLHQPLQPLQTFWQVGLTVFLRRLQALQLDSVLYQQWLAALLQDWNGNVHDDMSVRQCLQQVWYLWQDLGLLSQLPIQHDLEQYWSLQSNEWKSKEYRLVPFLQFCYSKLQHCNHWRPWLPAQWLWNILDVHLVQPHLNTDYLVSDTHLFPVLAEHVFAQHKDITPYSTNLTPIQQLWMLAGRLPGGQPHVSQAIQRFARQQGLQRMGVSAVAPNNNSTTIAPNKPKKGPNAQAAAAVSTAVEDLLQLQDCLVSMIQQLPGAAAPNEHGTTNSSIISLKSVWEEVVNVDMTPSLAEQLAKFLDATLRSNKKMDTYQSQSGSSSDYGWLQRIIAGLFVPLQAKDVFEAFYKRDLAKRLLWSRVVSMDVEKQVCSLLKAECGAGYTSKMEGMFQDVEWSRETMLVYKQSTAGTSANSSVEVEVQVLTTGYWPVYPIYPNLHLPDALKDPQDQFANHYKTKYQGRRMTWQYALGHCVVRANGFAKPYDFLVSLCQALVLIQFETSDTTLTLPQLLQAVGIEDRGEMERILQSLALGKDGTRILRKIDYDAEHGKKKKPRMIVDDRDTYVINSSFESNQRRIRIPNMMMKESKEEREKTVEAVSRDRLYLIDAVLVRIMKARKTILHQALIPQVLEQVKVPAQPADVKKRIESLIEREYMERDAKDRNRYNYLA
jgi:Cullin family/Cullin protein neddylation domain